MIQYIEDQGQTVDLQMIATTLTGGVLWRFHPRWDVSGSGFYNVFSLNQTATRTDGSTVDANTQYYGFNLRGGWRFSSPRGALDWRLAGGLYFWGMNVTPADYGIRSLIGPQFFVQVRNNQKQSRPWGAYIKYALTGSGFGISPANGEVAGGGDIQLGRLFERPVSATIDLSASQFSGASQDETGAEITKEMRMSTVSLGVRMQF
jgi:hypothetical protein